MNSVFEVHHVSYLICMIFVSLHNLNYEQHLVCLEPTSMSHRQTQVVTLTLVLIKKATFESIVNGYTETQYCLELCVKLMTPDGPCGNLLELT